MAHPEVHYRSVDVIDDLLFVGPAFEGAVRQRQLPLTVRRVESNWIAYIQTFDQAADVVILRSELNDHVPTILKVRALREIAVLPVVLADDPSPEHRWRLMHEGAAAVLTRDDSFEHLIASTLVSGASVEGAAPTTVSDARLSDRELQVAALYSGSEAPSATVIAGILGVPLASVRTHLQRARVALRVVGPTSNRASLGRALALDGWTDS